MITIYQSCDSFDETITKIKQILADHSLKIFAEIDHASEAEHAALTLNKATVLIFGNPKAGTLLMQDNIECALELPLKILLYEKKESCFINYHKPSIALAPYQLNNQELIGKMDAIYDLIKKTTTA